MNNLILLTMLLFVMLFTSCKKEALNANPGKVTGFTISGGTPIQYNWSDAVDADGDVLTYDLYLLTSDSSTPVLISEGNTQSKYDTNSFPSGNVKAMVVITKDGKGGESTSVEAPTIIL